VPPQDKKISIFLAFTSNPDSFLSQGFISKIMTFEKSRRLIPAAFLFHHSKFLRLAQTLQQIISKVISSPFSKLISRKIPQVGQNFHLRGPTKMLKFRALKNGVRP
jgi:hypothetical protein